MPTACPPPATLRDFLDGRIPHPGFQKLEDHLRDCTDCQGKLDGLYGQADSLSLLIAAAFARSGNGCAEGSFAEASRSAASLSEVGRFSQPAAGEVIRDYRILECIGRGGMGSVYRAFHLLLARQVALKTLNLNRVGSDEAVSRFRREMMVSARLEHPNIVRVLDAGDHAGQLYYVMELIPGVDLRQLVRRIGPLPTSEACQIARTAAAALHFAHEQKVIHRDVKPSNLMLTGDGKLKLLDLGLAQYFDLQVPVDDEISRAGQAVGTLAYMSPEQLSGRHPISPQSDIYSLGLTLQELLTGRRPCDPADVSSMIAEIRSIRTDIDEGLLSLVREMLATNPTHRPQSMAEVEARLSAFAEPAQLAGLVAEYYRWSTRNSLGDRSEIAAGETDARANCSRTRESNSAQIPNKGLWSSLPTSSRAMAKLAGCVIITAIACLGAPPLWQFSSQYASLHATDNQPIIPSAPAKRTGSIEVVAVGDVANSLLEEGCVLLENLVTHAAYPVTAGRVDALPPGKYRVQYEGPEEFYQDGDEIEVFVHTTNRLSLRPVLTKFFQYPEIPEVAGSNAAYRGSIWRAGWDAESPLAFRLHLEVLSVSTDLPRKKWLMIEVYLPGSDYYETAYLQMEASKWEYQQQLVFSDGFIVADSPQIKDFLARRGWSGKPLVVPFDLHRDTLDALDGLPLPTQRLSIHDVICLYFGEEKSAAAESIKTLRAHLASALERHEWLGHENYGTSAGLVLIESSRVKGDDMTRDGYKLARRKSDKLTPFGFVNLEVRFPTLQAACKMDRGGVSQRTASETDQLIVGLRGNLFSNLEPVAPGLSTSAIALQVANEIWSKLPAARASLKPKSAVKSDQPQAEPVATAEPAAPAAAPLSAWPFDLASMPDQPAFATWQGTITRKDLPIETITATAKYLGSEQTKGHEYLWIEVEVNNVRENEPDRWEAARVKIDATAYRDSCSFIIRQGWIAYGSRQSVFSIPVDCNLDALLDLRIQLQDKLQPERIGVADVLAMLFAADLKPMSEFAQLRAKLSGVLAGSQRQMKLESRTLKSGRVLNCERWEPPTSFSMLNYSFLRSSEIPFGFVAVSLDVFDLKVRLEVSNQNGLLPTDHSASVFGTLEELANLLNTNKLRLQPVQNMRVWTWTQAGSIYKAWAEFGGLLEAATGGSDVLLRNTAGREIRVPLDLLAKPDQQIARQGRMWSKATFGQSDYSLQRVLVHDNESLGQLHFSIPSAPNITSLVMFNQMRDPADRTWVLKRRAASKQKPEALNNPRAWEAFADYKR